MPAQYLKIKVRQDCQKHCAFIGRNSGTNLLQHVACARLPFSVSKHRRKLLTVFLIAALAAKDTEIFHLQSTRWSYLNPKENRRRKNLRHLTNANC